MFRACSHGGDSVTPEPGWFKRQADIATEEARHWPQHMKRNAGLQYNSEVDSRLTDHEVELIARCRELEAASLHAGLMQEKRIAELETSISAANAKWEEAERNFYLKNQELETSIGAKEEELLRLRTALTWRVASDAGLRSTCGQCGQTWNASACGPTHAMLFRELEVAEPALQKVEAEELLKTAPRS